jgi:hypothetical protein
VNLAHVVAAVEFVAAQMVEPPGELVAVAEQELPPNIEVRSPAPGTAIVASL